MKIPIVMFIARVCVPPVRVGDLVDQYVSLRIRPPSRRSVANERLGGVSPSLRLRTH